jgi:hypothetical protein
MVYSVFQRFSQADPTIWTNGEAWRLKSPFSGPFFDDSGALGTKHQAPPLLDTAQFLMNR